MSVVTPVAANNNLTCEDVNYEVSGDYECGQPVAWVHANEFRTVHVCHTCYLEYYSKN